MMTLQELSRYYRLREQLFRDEKIIEALRAAATSGVQVLTGMPHAPGVKDKVGNLAAEIVDMEKSIKLLRLDMMAEEQRVTKFIDTIEDEYTRRIFLLRFIMCYTWSKVAVTVGGGNTEDAVKKTCYRYIDRNP